jgi:hypothetical protein
VKRCSASRIGTAAQTAGDSIRSAGEPTFVRQRTALRSLVDDWPEMNADQRKRVLATIFDEIVGSEDAIEFTPREGWRPYLKAALSKPRVLVAGSSPVFRSDGTHCRVARPPVLVLPR